MNSMMMIRERSVVQSLKHKLAPAQSMGFIPTMGCLHEGHAELIKRSVQENDITVLSIFVNPTQFNDPADYQHYPQTLSADIRWAKQLGVDYLWLPTEKDLYPDGNVLSFDLRDQAALRFEGAARPGHLNGVLTVVLKLLQVVRPTRVYFGEKDYQQCLAVSSLIKNFFIPVEMVVCSTIRDASGLPYSSRHARLSIQGKALAKEAAGLLHQLTSPDVRLVRQQLETRGILVDYLEVENCRCFVAFYIENIRLIDNFMLSADADLQVSQAGGHG